MKIQDKCIPCMVSQAIKTADMVGLKEKEDLLRNVFAYMSRADFKTSTTPELTGDLFALLKEEIGNDDPYRATRAHYNKMFLEQLLDLEREINKAGNPFLESIRYAIIGNIIDFNPVHDFSLMDMEECFARLKEEPLERDDSVLLYQEVQKAETLLYLGDNCGEICLDEILVKKIREINPRCRIFFATRGAAVINDSVEEDAYSVGMDAYATIISNGDSSMGTVLHRTSEAFREIYRKADVVISKGQANYECLSDEKKNLFFLLMTKCKVIADEIGVPVGKLICMKSRIQEKERICP